MYPKIFFILHGHYSNFFIFALIIFHILPKSERLTTIKSSFSREMETTKVPKLFYHHHTSVHDATKHLNNIVIFLIFFSKSMGLTLTKILSFFVKCSIS